MTVVIKRCDKPATFVVIDQLFEMIGQLLCRFERYAGLVNLRDEYRVVILE